VCSLGALTAVKVILSFRRRLRRGGEDDAAEPDDGMSEQQKEAKLARCTAAAAAAAAVVEIPNQEWLALLQLHFRTEMMPKGSITCFIRSQEGGRIWRQRPSNIAVTLAVFGGRDVTHFASSVLGRR